MGRESAVKLAKFLLAAAALCLLLWPGTASADPADVVTFNFTGNAVCDSSSPSPCSPNVGAITGTFSVDPDTESIVGSWSFATPFGTIASSDVMAVGFIVDEPGLDLIDFVSTSNNIVTSVQLDFTENAIPGIGSFAPFSNTISFPSFLCQAPTSTRICSVVYDVTSGKDPQVASPTPEPSSLLLLGTGLLGLGPVLRRRLAKS